MQYTPNDKFGGDLYGRNGADGAEERLSDRAGDLVHDVGTAALENGKAALQNLHEKTEAVTKDVTALYGDGAALLRKQVATKPIAAITIAMATGAILAGLMFRK